LTVIEMNPTQLTTFRSHFELSLLANRICMFAAKILREYKTSGLTYLSGALTTVLLFITTVLVFAFINFAVFKLDSAAFEFNSTPTLFTFFHYSFENMLLSLIRDLIAVSTMSYDVNMMQKMFSVLLIPIFVSQIIVIQKQRFTEELDAVIRRIESASHAMESFIFNEYRVSTIEEALAEIEGFKGSLVRILLFLTERLKY
jgi:hypothetical protein